MKRRAAQRWRFAAAVQEQTSHLQQKTRKLFDELVAVQNENHLLKGRLWDPEGEIQRGINARYTRDLREREMQHHADWDAEVVVHKMAAARWMRSCVLEFVTDEAVRAQIEALPLVPE
jgi:hypothetical protein